MNIERMTQGIVRAIWADCQDRSGMDLGCLPDETQDEIRDAWTIEVRAQIQTELQRAAEEI